MGKCNNSHAMGKVWRSIIILFPQYGCFFPIQFPSYGILQHMGNVWASPYIFHSTGKCNKTHGMAKVWEIDTHTFPIAWVLFSHQILILWYTSSHGKCMGFPINFSQYGKMQQNPSYGVNLGNWYSYVSHSIGDFSSYDFHPTVYFIIWEIHGFPHQFPIVQENATKLI